MVQCVLFGSILFALFISFGIPSHFILFTIFFCVVSSNATFKLWRSRTVLVLLKLLNLFISSFRCFYASLFFFCSWSIARSAILTSRPSVHVCFYSFCNESFYTGNVFHKVVYVAFSISFVRSFFPFFCLCSAFAAATAPYYCLQCNFRLFAVRLYCFIFRINSHWRLFHLQCLLRLLL